VVVSNLAVAALPAASTNGAEWGSHTGLATGTPLYVESQTLASLGGITNTAAGIAAAGGLTNRQWIAWSSVTGALSTAATTLTINSGTATVNSAACWLAPGNGTNVVLLPPAGTTASDQIMFGVTVSNFGRAVGYTNSLNLSTNSGWFASCTNIVCTNTATAYWLIGGRGAYQTTWEIRGP
jgi:hypothetical protein